MSVSELLFVPNNSPSSLVIQNHKDFLKLLSSKTAPAVMYTERKVYCLHVYLSEYDLYTWVTVVARSTGLLLQFCMRHMNYT